LKPVVLQLIDSFHQGGSERQALHLARLLCNNKRFAVRLAALNPEGSLRQEVDDLDLGDIPSFPLSSFYDRNAINQLRRLVAWLKSSRIRILHTHDFYTNIFGMAAGALARTPVRIASCRETTGMRSSSQRQVQRLAYSVAHHVVANSQAVKDKLLREGVPPEKVAVVYNGLDESRLVPHLARPETLRLLGLNHGHESPRLYVTIVANMRHEVKDYPMFLRAARKVKDSIPDSAFILAGEGELTESLRLLSRDLGIQESTVFLGRFDQVAELLSVSDVCVLSSKAEGFSNSILEYMAAARPVVVTDVGGAREAVVENETGFIVPSGDFDAMANRIIFLLSNPERARAMGRKGKLVVSEKFSCETQLERTEELYLSALQTTGSGVSEE
jgi:L-malate glycosyltransferase